uniref:Glyoxylate reductase/hydroxypyruvate reductase n=1 Tax=Culicoides sonorensis TaxID=179676 RepID=A0A336LW09_CULSO
MTIHELLRSSSRVFLSTGLSWKHLSSSLKIFNREIVFNVTRKISNMSRPSVYLTRPDVAQQGIQLLQDECDVTMWDKTCPVPREELLKRVVGKDAIYCTLCDKIDAEVLDAAGPSLKVIGTISVGYDHIDVEECRKRGVRIGYTPDVLTDATAELTLALLLATSRRLFEANREVYNGGWKAWSPSWMCGMGLKNSTVGIVGFGRIGYEVAKRLIPFKPKKILYFNRSDKPQFASEIGAERVGSNDLLANSDFVICTIALTPDTHHLFDSVSFSKMKPNSIFINTSRGGVVDQEALYEALVNRQIYAAGLDVTTPEPLPLNSKLLTLPNCIILPHIGSAEYDTRKEMSRITACNILAGIKGIRMADELE